MFNSFNDFYSKMSQSFIDYLKHIFSDAPKPPKPDLPKLPPRPRGKSFGQYLDMVTSKTDSFFSLRRLYALKENFNSSTGYYNSWSDAVFSLETIKYAMYCLMFGIFAYFVYLNYENIGGLITTIANGLYNYVVQLPVNTFNFVISIPTKIYNGVAAAYTSVPPAGEYFTNFTLFPPRDNTRFAQYQYQAPEPLPRIPSETPSYRELRDSIASVFGNVNPAAQVHPSAASTSTVAAGTALPASEIATTGTHSAWGSNTPAAPVTNPPSYNPAAVGLNLTNSQLAGLSPKKIQGLCLPPARWRTKAPPGQCEYLNI